MNLTIRVTDAAYTKKVDSDGIIYELVPRFDLEDAPMSPSRRPSWLSSPCVRQSDTLEGLHQRLVRKHPNLLLPSFPRVSRKCAGWGSEALLQSMRRRLERYFARLLARAELQEDLALHDFMSNKGDKAEVKAGGLWEHLSFGRWFGNGGSNDQNGKSGSLEALEPVSEERVLIYEPVNVGLPEEVHLQTALGRSVQLRAHSLSAASHTLDATMKAVQRCSEALGRVSKSLHELTSTHVRHLVSSDSDYSSFRTGTLQDDSRTTERRFRELGDRFIDLINQLQPGLQVIHHTTTASVGEVLSSQLSEIPHVRHFINREVGALRRYDQQIGQRKELQAKLAIAEGQPTPKSRQIERLAMARDVALGKEDELREDFQTRATHLREEMNIYWAQTAQEFFSGVKCSLRAGLEVSRLHVDALRAWFPPES